jgi:hypothetical protein
MTSHEETNQVRALMLFVLLFAAAYPVFSGEKPESSNKQRLLHELMKPSVGAEREGFVAGLNLQPMGEQEKSVFQSVVYSLVLPGMGELYAGGFESGRYFLIAESGLWLTFTSFELYGHWVQNDARSFAASHASALIEGQDDQFFVNIGNFDNVYQYNEKKLRDRDLGSVYDPNGPFYWQWDSDASRARFKDLRVKSDNIFNNVRFVVAGIILNHIASAINAARIAVKKNKELADSWQVQTGILGSYFHPDGVVLTVRKSF